MSHRRLIFATLFVCVLTTALNAVDGDKAQYVGGTVPGLKENAEGKLTHSDTQLSFSAGKDGSFVLPYDTISGLEYGQKAGRRVGVAVMVSPLALFSKKRKHFLTLTYKDSAGKEQAGVFELGKEIVRTTLKILEVRTGKPIEFQDKEACHQYKTPKECDGK